ncbi:uncharacterized protein LOC128205156 isoform X2 [Mya arenaria]|nr:uncharacterized protein LOC128205156 isoform X2 [Mya arenaria]
MKNLCTKLSELGEECFVVTVNATNGWTGNIGTDRGDEFVQSNSHLLYDFLSFCQVHEENNPDYNYNTDSSEEDVNKTRADKTSFMIQRPKYINEAISESGQDRKWTNPDIDNFPEYEDERRLVFERFERAEEDTELHWDTEIRNTSNPKGRVISQEVFIKDPIGKRVKLDFAVPAELKTTADQEDAVNSVLDQSKDQVNDKVEGEKRAIKKVKRRKPERPRRRRSWRRSRVSDNDEGAGASDTEEDMDDEYGEKSMDKRDFILTHFIPDRTEPIRTRSRQQPAPDET